MRHTTRQPDARRSARSYHFPLGLILALAVGSPDGAAGQARPGPNALSDSDCALLAAYSAALAEVEVRAASREELLRQLRTQPPVAKIEGYWVTPVDLLLLANEPRPARRDVVAFAFTPSHLKEQFQLPFVGDFESVTDASAGAVGVVVVPVKDSSEVITEYLPPPVRVEEPECYYFCGDPTSWDFDRDGIPNADDPDDDGDGTPDEDDAYPYWAARSDCDCGDRQFVGFTEKFSPQVTALVQGAYDELVGRERGKLVPLDGEHVEPRATLLVPENPCGPDQAGCPIVGAPGVRYVSDDAAACARLRFRCGEGEEAFSNQCGCGCKPAKR